MLHNANKSCEKSRSQNSIMVRHDQFSRLHVAIHKYFNNLWRNYSLCVDVPTKAVLSHH